MKKKTQWISSLKIRRIEECIIVVVAIAALALYHPVFAISAGPNNGSSSADDTTVGTVAWSSDTNVYASDDARNLARFVDADGTSYYEKVTGFGFSIPAGATINGIVVEVERSESKPIACSFMGTVIDNSVKIVKGGTISGNEKAAVGEWPTTDAYKTYGGSADLWGATWTDTDINASNFGIVISVNGTADADTCVDARIDHIRITVYYTEAANTAPTGTWNSAVQKSDGTGVVDLSIEVADADGNLSKALVEYETTGSACDGPWAKATLQTPITADFSDTGGVPDINNSNAYQVGSTSGTKIKTASGSNTVDFDWASATDISAANGTYCLRLTVNDGTVDQATPATQTLTLDNTAPTAPGNLTNFGRGRNAVILDFGSQTTDTNFSTYKIFYKQGTSGVTVNDTQHTDANLGYIDYNGIATTTITGLTANTAYVFNIWAYDSYGNKTAAASEVTITTLNTFMQTGYYMGDGTNNRAITGVGFSPDAIFIKDETTMGDDGMIWTTSAVTTGNTYSLTENQAAVTTQVLSLDSGGFTIGTDDDSNSPNERYLWIAFDASDCSSTGIVCVGSYVGDGTNGKTVTVGFQPDFVMVKQGTGTANNGRWRTSSMADTVDLRFSEGSAGANCCIVSFTSTGFTVNSNAVTNQSSTTYYFLAFRNMPGEINFGTYIGNAIDDRNITGVGFTPDWVFVKTGGAVGNMQSHNNENYQDVTSQFNDATSNANVIQKLQADGFQIGTTSLVNTNAQAYYWGAFQGAVDPPASGTFYIATGSYTGSGSGQSITGVGFAPDLVVIKHTDQVTDQEAVFRTSLMAGDATLPMGSATNYFNGGITSINSDGFTVGTSATVDTSGDTYHWQAFGNAFRPDTGSGAADFTIGAYYGNSGNPRDISRLPFQPDFVMTKASSTTNLVFRTSNMSGDLSGYTVNAAENTNEIKALNSDGFQLGNRTVNTNAILYNWVAFKSGANFAVGSYTGTGSAQNVTGLSFQPELVWVKRTTTGTTGVFRPSTIVGDGSQYFTATANTTDRITGFLSNGFSIGGNQTETNTSASTYRYVAWNSGAAFYGSGTLISSNIDTNSYSTIYNHNLLRIQWTQNIPTGCTLTVSVCGDTATDCPSANWQAYSGSGTTVIKDVAGTSALQGKRYFQYKAAMTSCVGSNETPTLYDLLLEFD